MARYVSGRIGLAIAGLCIGLASCAAPPQAGPGMVETAERGNGGVRYCATFSALRDGSRLMSPVALPHLGVAAANSRPIEIVRNQAGVVGAMVAPAFVIYPAGGTAPTRSPLYTAEVHAPGNQVPTIRALRGSDEVPARTSVGRPGLNGVRAIDMANLEGETLFIIEGNDPALVVTKVCTAYM